jgi:hypothetical protein
MRKWKWNKVSFRNIMCPYAQQCWHWEIVGLSFYSLIVQSSPKRKISCLVSCLRVAPFESWKVNDTDECIPKISSCLRIQSGFLIILSFWTHLLVESSWRSSSAESSFPCSLIPVRTRYRTTLDYHTSRLPTTAFPWHIALYITCMWSSMTGAAEFAAKVRIQLPVCQGFGMPAAGIYMKSRYVSVNSCSSDTRKCILYLCEK